MSSEFIKTIGDKLQSHQQAGVHEECVVCLEPMEDAVILQTCAHVLCRECAMGILDKAKLKVCAECRVPFGKADMLTVPRQNRFAIDLESAWQPSSKTTALIDTLKDIRTNSVDKVEKAVVFSQWTAYLDVSYGLCSCGSQWTAYLDVSYGLCSRGSQWTAYLDVL